MVVALKVTALFLSLTTPSVDEMVETVRTCIVCVEVVVLDNVLKKLPEKVPVPVIVANKLVTVP